MLKPTAAVEDTHRHFDGTVALPGGGRTRREMLAASAAIIGVELAGGMSLAFGQQPSIRPTNEQVLGPFYPVRLPADQERTRFS